MIGFMRRIIQRTQNDIVSKGVGICKMHQSASGSFCIGSYYGRYIWNREFLHHRIVLLDLLAHASDRCCWVTPSPNPGTWNNNINKSLDMIPYMKL